MISCFGLTLNYSKLVKCGNMHSLFFKCFKRFRLTYKIDEKYVEKNDNLLFSGMIKYSPSVSCDIINVGSPFHFEHNHPLELVTQNIIGIWIMLSSNSFRFLEQSFIIRKVPYQNLYFKQHIVHPVLQMWMPSNFDWYNMIHSTVAKVSRIVPSALRC